MAYTYWNCFDNNSKSFVFVSGFTNNIHTYIYIGAGWKNCIDKNEKTVYFQNHDKLICTLKFKCSLKINLTYYYSLYHWVKAKYISWTLIFFLQQFQYSLDQYCLVVIIARLHLPLCSRHCTYIAITAIPKE